HSRVILRGFAMTPTYYLRVSPPTLSPALRRSLRQNVYKKSDSIPFAEYRMRSRAVHARVQGGAERLARPRSRDVETTLHSTSTSRRVPGARSLDRRAFGWS